MFVNASQLETFPHLISWTAGMHGTILCLRLDYTDNAQFSFPDVNGTNILNLISILPPPDRIVSPSVSCLDALMMSFRSLFSKSMDAKLNTLHEVVKDKSPSDAERDYKKALKCTFFSSKQKFLIYSDLLDLYDGMQKNASTAFDYSPIVFDCMRQLRENAEEECKETLGKISTNLRACIYELSLGNYLGASRQFNEYDAKLGVFTRACPELAVTYFQLQAVLMICGELDSSQSSLLDSGTRYRTAISYLEKAEEIYRSRHPKLSGSSSGGDAGLLYLAHSMDVRLGNQVTFVPTTLHRRISMFGNTSTLGISEIVSFPVSPVKNDEDRLLRHRV